MQDVIHHEASTDEAVEGMTGCTEAIIYNGIFVMSTGFQFSLLPSESMECNG
jgi:hypothetical protein